jgi:galactose oxidase-like protein
MGPCALRPSSFAIPVTLLVAALIPALSPAQTFTWSRWPMPYPRHDHVAVYDPVGDRMVVNGGISATETDAGDSGETWALALGVPPRWEVIPSSIPRSGSIAVYDPPGERMIVFGGIWDGVRLSGTNQLLLASDAWAGGFSGSGAPPAGNFSAPAYDALRRRMLAYPWGAHVVCQLNLATNVWSTFAVAGPIPGFVVCMAYDDARDRLIARPGDNTTWQLTLSGTPTWSPLATAGTPPPDSNGDLLYDAVRDRMLQARADGTVWALSMEATPTWSSIAKPPLPTGSHNPRTVLDAARDRLLWFGSGTLNDTWAFRLSDATWYLVEPGSPIPVLAMHTAVAAAPWDALVVFGGVNGPRSNTTWRLPLSGKGPFVQVATAGTKPAARYGHAAIYDPIRQRMVVFGGNDGSQLMANDVWALSIDATPTWSQLLSSTDGHPTGRQNSHAVYDPVRDRMVILGGVQWDGTIRSELIALTLGPTPGFVSLATDAALPAVEYTDLVYDSRRDHFIAIGKSSTDTRAWWMPGDGPYTWTQFAGTLTPARREFAATYDAGGDRVLLHGGYDDGSVRTFNWLQALNPETGQWSSLPTGPLARYDHTLTFDPSRNRFALFGGHEQGPDLNPYQAYNAGSVWFAHDPQSVLDVAPPASASATLAFRRLWLAAPNAIAFEMGGTGVGSTRVEAFDIAGRRLGATTLGAGDRSGTIGLAAAARPGIVVARARQGSATVSRRLAVLR